jgi:hypothetical protein
LVYIFIGLAVLILAAGLKLFHVISLSATVFANIRRSRDLIMSPDLSDEDKEVALRQAAAHMMRLSLSLTGCALSSAVVPVAIVIIGERLAFYSYDEVMSAASDPYFLIGSSLLLIGALTVK